jgi:phenylacetate-CoA ligase
VQVVDVETGEPLPDGSLGSLCVTELYKTGTAQFRYNILDLSYLYPKGQCACGSWLRKIGPFAGRGDNMVKLRGVNLWPEGVGEVACTVSGTLPDYFVTASRVNNRDELSIIVVSDRDSAQFADIQAEIERVLNGRFGLKIAASVVRPGEIDHLTEFHTSPKPKRFKDARGS